MQHDGRGASEARRSYEAARELVTLGKALDAIACVERAMSLDPENPTYTSLYALLITRERGQLKLGLDLALKAAEASDFAPETCLNLAAICVRAERRADAVSYLDRGLERSPDHAELARERRALGKRRDPVLGFLHRHHPINKYLGLLATRLRGRG